MKKPLSIGIMLIFMLCSSLTGFAQTSSKTVTLDETFIRDWYKKINQIDLEGIDQMLHEKLVFEDKTAPFIWDKEKTMNFFKQRHAMGIQNTRTVEVEDIYFINSNIVDVHGVWVGMVNGEKKRVKFSTVFIFYENKIIRWTDHYDMASFK